MDKEYNQKRIHPPFHQHDYHVLRRLFTVLETLTKKYVTSQKGILVDYGCGSVPYKGLFLPYVARYIGVDIDKNSTADILLSENSKIPLKNSSIDIVVSTQVLEHIDRVDFYLSETKRLLKKDGLLFLSTHGIWPYHPCPCDYHRWTRKGLEKALQESGFRCLETVPILGPFAAVTQFTLLLIAERLIGKGIVAKILLTIFSLVGNSIIFLEDRLFPPNGASDASLYVICAKKK